MNTYNRRQFIGKSMFGLGSAALLSQLPLTGFADVASSHSKHDVGFQVYTIREMLVKDFDKSAFTTINIMQVTDIPIAAKDVELLTNHPSDSYTLVSDDTKKGMITNLVITNPEKFWSTSKYLVIVKK